MRLRAASSVLVLGLLSNAVLARVLDAMGLVDGLLAPSGAWGALLLPLSVVFYSLRLFVWFVAPGLVLGALCAWAMRKRPSRDPRS